MLQTAYNQDLSIHVSHSGLVFIQEEHDLPLDQRYQIVSLGDNCLPAFYLKKYALRDRSYPWDWIQSNIKMVIHMLTDNFVKFLDPDISEMFYSNAFLDAKSIFNHHDLHKVAHLEYYQRCVDRFRSLATCSPESPIIFVMSINQEPSLQSSEIICWEDLHTIVSTLIERYKINLHCLLIIVFQQVPRPDIHRLLTEPPPSELPYLNRVHLHHMPNARPVGAMMVPEYELEFRDLILQYLQHA